MKISFYLSLTITLLLFFAVSCNEKKTTEIHETVTLDSLSVSLFAKQLVFSVQNGNPDFFNRAFDEAYIRKIISENSIVFSSLDTEFGQFYFEESLKYGDKALAAIDNGGDVHFIRYYKDDNQHHIILCFYYDYSMNIYDFIVDTADNQLKIKDGFIYDLSTTLVNEIKYNVLFNVLNKTNPDGITFRFIEAAQMLEEGKNREVLLLLQEKRELLEEYPVYHYYNMQAFLKTDPLGYISFLDEMEREGYDHRSILLHKMHYYCNFGNSNKTIEIIDSLINYTNDDPLYLLLFGKTNQEAGKYEDALYCYENATTGMAEIWDLWFGKLECYAKLNQTDQFYQTLQTGERLYGLKQTDLNELAKIWIDN